MPKAEFDALLFDVGNVVVEVDFNKVLAHWAEISRTHHTALQERFSFDAAYERHERGEISAQQYFDSLRQSLKIDISDEHFTAGWNAVFVDEMPGIRDLLTQVQSRWPMYAFSNTNKTHYREWWSRFEHLFSAFDQVFVSCDLGMRKPERAAFEHVAGAMGTRCERILFFDDSAANVEGAREAGMQAVLVRTFDDVHAAIAARSA